MRDPSPAPTSFYVRIKRNLLNYRAEADDESELIRMYIRDSSIPMQKLAHGLGITEQDASNIASGSGRRPDSQMRGSMKFIISNHLTALINAK